jgi:Gpi18-like mannosyltransferase
LIPIIIFLGFLFRFIIYPYEIPITLDGMDYFLYTVDLSRGNIFPEGYLINKFGWPIFLSPIFSIFQNSNMIELMNIQRVISIFISCITIIPIYFTITRFFNSKVALVAASLFIFNPKIIENSTLGISDPLFIFLIFLSIMFISSQKFKYQIFSFFIGGLSFVVRPEGILIILVLLTILILKQGLNKKIIKCIFFGILIFLGTLYVSDFFITFQNDQISIFDTLLNFKNIQNEEIAYGENEIGNLSNDFDIFLVNSISKFVIYSGWIMMPNIIFFALLSIIKIKKNFLKNIILFLLIYFELSFTALYAYGKNIEETRYLFVLFLPILLFSSYGINYIYEKLKVKNKILILIIPIIISSGIFLIYTTDDYVYPRELSFAVDVLVNEGNGVNQFDDRRFVKSSEVSKNWPQLPSLKENLKMDLNILKFSTDNYNNINEFVEKNSKNGLTHILVKEKNGDPLFNELLENEEDYPYLMKIFDYNDYNFKNKILIFKIVSSK